MFATAQKLAAPKKSAKPEAAKIAIEGLQEYAALDYLIKTLTALKATVEADVKSDVNNYFIKTGAAAKSRPANYKGAEGKAEASCQLKAKASNIAVDEASEALLAAHGIAVETVEQVAHTYVINPKYKDDQATLAKVEKALKKVKDLPEDFILEQEGQSKKVVPATALDAVFALGDADQIRALLPLVSSISVGPKLATDDLAEAFDMIKDLLGVEVAEAA